MRIAFISGMSGYPWGGSEVLWSQTALRFQEMGHSVFASVHGWPETPEPIQQLKKAGICVHERQGLTQSLILRIGNTLLDRTIRRNSAPTAIRKTQEALREFTPDLVCISHGGTSDALEFMEYCREMRFPYTSVAQANAEWAWPDDINAERLMQAYQHALLTCFVSEGNLHLFEMQIASKLSNAKIVRNPFHVSYESSLPWPTMSSTWKLACVGRLTQEKGQDLILQILSQPEWRDKPVEVSFFGKGPLESSLKRLSRMLKVDGKVHFRSHVENVEHIWKEHHALLLLSRSEGLPLALVEAMLCGRLAIVTDVAGNKEVLEDNVTGFLAAAPTLHLGVEAMNRAWKNRSHWESMGQAAAASIRENIPRDPIGEFTKLLQVTISDKPLSHKV